MHTQRQIDYLQAQRASEWFELLEQGDPQDRVAFGEWCRKSPLHIREFLEITCTDRALDELDFSDTESTEELTALLAAIPVKPPTLPASNSPVTVSRPGSGVWRWRRRWQWATAAVIAGFAVGTAFHVKPWVQQQEFSTKVGEQRTVELVDSSVVTLNTDSDIKIQFDGDVRKIELRRGEAVFKVARDPRRPFRVLTRAGTVQAVGTEFNVYERPEGTEVTVLEGRVRLVPHNGDGSENAAAQDLIGGEEARIALNGSIRRVKQPDIARVTAWSKRRLKFHNETLEEMALEFNRYQRDVQLRVEGIPANSRHYSGIFDADHPETLARFLEREPDLTVERSAREIVIRLRLPTQEERAH